MSAVNDRGFVDFIGDVVMKNQFGEGVGKVDVVLCANCLETAGTLVGGVTKDKAAEWGYREAELTMEVDKLKDEVQAWQERFVNIANLDLEDFSALAKVKEQKKIQVPES